MRLTLRRLIETFILDTLHVVSDQLVHLHNVWVVFVENLAGIDVWYLLTAQSLKGAP